MYWPFIMRTGTAQRAIKAPLVVIFHGNNPISWASRTQKRTARSTREAEYIALSNLCQEAIYIKMLLESLDESLGKVHVLSNEGTEEDPGCVGI